MYEKTIEAIKAAEIEGYEWPDPIIEALGNTYAGGYLYAKMPSLMEGLDRPDEEYREMFLAYCEDDIWFN